MSYDMRQRDNAEARYDTEPRDDTELRDDAEVRNDTELRDDAEVRNDTELRDDAEVQNHDELRDDTELREDTEFRNDPDLREDAVGVDPAEAREAEVREAELREDAVVDAAGEADADTYPDQPGAEPYRDPDTGIYRSAEATPAATGTAGAGTPSTAMPSAEMPSTESLWQETESSGFQARWREVQLRFVDDPRGAAEEAEALAGEVIDRFTAAVTARKRELDTWRDNAEAADTEQMRMAVRQYRQLLDRVFGV